MFKRLEARISSNMNIEYYVDPQICKALESKETMNEGAEGIEENIY